ncbi:MAG: ribonuclease J [Thermodesulfovibrionales bacterium]|nr:ribonuclease J [Thermodesulfovibrionales bacterium]
MSENPDVLKVIPLGGVEEIGMNMCLLQYSDQILIIDAGLMFPDEDMLGVDFAIPDITYIKENKEKIAGIVLTHGHEDHTGALPFILKEIPVNVYGTALTLALAREKLKEHRVDDSTLIPIKPRDKVSIGPFLVEFIRVTHSIVDGVGLGIETPVGLVVHTGDFKVDPTPVDGELMDFHKFTEYGERGTLLMMSDSTNAEKGGFTFSEKEVRRSFEDIFAKSKGRIIIATFASNIHRIQQAIDVSVQFGRRVALSGKSIISNANIAMKLGYLKVPPDTLIKFDSINDYADGKIVIITTGSQGEPMSVLSRIATGEHKLLKIKDEDTVILSAKVIPGNERAIGKIINHLMRRGADVIYEKVSEIHVSGHASKEELKLMINLIKPKYFMPIHGEYRHLKYHSKLAEKSGISKDRIFIMENGEILEINSEMAKKNGRINTGKVFVDGKDLGGVEDMVLRDRRVLAEDGIVIIIATIERLSRRVQSPPEIVTRGFIFEDTSANLLNEAKEMLYNMLQGVEYDILSDAELVKAKLRSNLKKFIRNRMDRKPLIMPIVIEV